MIIEEIKIILTHYFFNVKNKLFAFTFLQRDADVIAGVLEIILLYKSELKLSETHEIFYLLANCFQYATETL